MSEENPAPPRAEEPDAPAPPEPEGPAPEAGGEDELARLRAEAEEARARAEGLDAQLVEAREKALAREAELVDRLQRLQADFENFRRRARDESAAAGAKGKEELLRALLPVLDNLDRALAHAQDEGLQLVARQLGDTLRAAGVATIDPAGEAFDARLHEAIARAAREGAKPGSVLDVVEKGYSLEGRVVRPARVVVAE